MDMDALQGTEVLPGRDRGPPRLVTDFLSWFSFEEAQSYLLAAGAHSDSGQDEGPDPGETSSRNQGHRQELEPVAGTSCRNKRASEGQ